MPIYEDVVNQWMDLTGPQSEELLLTVMEEEAKELLVAIEEYRRTPAWVESKMNLLKEMCDVTFTNMVFTEHKGWDYGGAFDEVGESNLSKGDMDGNLTRREDGKILKGEYYYPPNMEYFI